MIRDATPDDAERIAEIYAEQVLYGTATAEEVPPDAAEMARRMAAVSADGKPWIVWQDPANVAGYAYLRAYHPRAAYRHTVENGIYIAPESRGRHVGRALLAALIERAGAAGARQMVASITAQGGDASIALHTGAGLCRTGAADGHYRKVRPRYGTACIYSARLLRIDDSTAVRYPSQCGRSRFSA